MGEVSLNLSILITPIVLYLLVVFILVVSYRKNRYQLRFWGKIYTLNLVAKLIVNKRLFEAETISKNGKKKTKITYYPRIFVKFVGSGFRVFLPLDGNKFQKQFQDGSFSHELVMATRATVSDEISEDGFLVHEFLTFPEKSRISIDEMRVSHDKIEIMKGLTWNFAKVPHMLVAGDTGSGKSFFLFSMISGILKSGANLTIADPKRTDLASLASTKALKGKVVYSDERIMKAFTKFYNGMYERSVEYSELLKNSDSMGDYRDYGLRPEFFLFDEYGAFFSKLDWKQQEELKRMATEITMLGRQLGYFLIIALQRPDADTIGAGARDQFQFRVTLGKMKSNGLSLIFPDDDPNDFINLSKDVKGWGYAQMSPDKTRAFFAPLIPKEFKAKRYFDELGKKLEVTVDRQAPHGADEA
ncbi:cell division protein FtsK [Weissella viridescens]|uniref:Cell division protein FtsK n=2 Tax=Weissella viridescens TaxID=1629 RepID=A0A3P2RLP4_WEIVI|nr:cell division protein FtsK [Weissella viridescens]